MRVFISYATEDGLAYAKKLYDILRKRGHDPFLIIHELCVSENPWDRIFGEIKSRELTVFVITESSQMSNGQKQEYDFATTKFKTKTAFSSESAWKKGIVENRFPSLTIPQALTFTDNDFEEKCEMLSTQLVRLKDNLEKVKELEIDKKETIFPKLTIEGLAKSVIAKCKASLFDSYQKETIIPDAFSVSEAKSLDNFINIGFSYRLPREWFLPYEETNTAYYNEILFMNFGRTIALGERDYLNQLITSSKDISCIERPSDSVDDFLEQIKEALETLASNKAEAKIIYPSIDDWLKFHQFKADAKIKYSNIMPRPILSSSIVVKDTELKIILPLGKIPKHTIIFGKDSVKWYIKRYPEYASLYVDLGNDRLFPKKFVQVVAMTTAKCDINPKGIVILKRMED